jgi:hypothetical protein
MKPLCLCLALFIACTVFTQNTVCYNYGQSKEENFTNSINELKADYGKKKGPEKDAADEGISLLESFKNNIHLNYRDYELDSLNMFSCKFRNMLTLKISLEEYRKKVDTLFKNMTFFTDKFIADLDIRPDEKEQFKSQNFDYDKDAMVFLKCTTQDMLVPGDITIYFLNYKECEDIGCINCETRNVDGCNKVFLVNEIKKIANVRYISRNHTQAVKCSKEGITNIFIVTEGTVTSIKMEQQRFLEKTNNYCYQF